MPEPLSSPRRNLERKFRCADLSAAAAAVEQLGARYEGVLEQTDVYFRVPNGRVKLRTTQGQPAFLIWYERPDEINARWSRYYLVPISDPTTLRAALAAALGERGEVRKRRTLWLWHNVRIHLDEVAGLGTFVEFEAVMSASDDETTAHARLAELAAALGLTPADGVEGSYADLLGF
ncbi:MAG TPA: class IV adenylate cyclase [Gemmataceae bacterium]|nr:class IV adenylate cyclase [Gemmataceae bacterium]